MATEQSDAVVLRSVPYRDADLVVTLLTRDHGKVSAMARGARRSRRRFGAALALFVLGRAELRRSRGSELWTLASFDALQDYSRIGADLAAMAHASYGVEIARELLAAEQPDPEVLDLLVELFSVLADRGASPMMLRAFELRLLTYVGLGPSLERCVSCGSEATEDIDARGVVLDGARGGVMCEACAIEGKASKPLSAAARALLVAAAGAPDLASAHAGEQGTRAAAEARDAMLAMLLAHIGKPLRSVEFIAKMSGAMVRSAHGE